MSQQMPIVGQRFISQSEPELGLGRVSQFDGRLLSLEFPAVSESRTYQYRSAPVSRILFQSGDQIRGSQDPAWKDRQWRVTEVDLEQELARYTLISDVPGESLTVSEIDLPSDIRFGSPDQRFLSGQIDRLSSFDTYVETLSHDAMLKASSLSGLAGCRTELLPHQLYLAEKVSSRIAPRVLLADEVGLGKTIEAGMILHRLLLTGQVRRVLLLVPDSLVHQWLVEMLRRFNLTFSLFDVDRFMSLIESEVNPFETEQLILCSMDLVTLDEVILAAISQASWDMMVVDEAHHLSWSPDAVDPMYDCVDQLSRLIDGVLLLTATPESAGLDGQFGLLRLLDPDRFHDLEAYRQEQTRYSKVNDCIAGVMESEEQGLEQSIDTINQTLQLTGAQALSDNLERDELIQQLLDRHGTGRVLFRNTRKAVGGFPERILHHQRLIVPEPYQTLAADEPVLFPERVWSMSKHADTDSDEPVLSTEWCQFDPRVNQLMTLLNQLGNRKVLLICHHAETAVELAKHCRDNGLRCAAFHEHMTLVERDRAAAYFSDMEDGAQLLVCSEIGSEGRNFQFANHMVMFDLPANPDLIEQRIGRLDRIGQQHAINIHVWPLENTAQMVLFDWMNIGLSLFSRSLSGAWGIYLKHADELDWLMNNPDEQSRTETLFESTRADVDHMLAMQQAGRDRLIELNSCRSEQANDIIDRIIEMEQGGPAGNQLQSYLYRLLDELGIDHEFHSDQTDVLREGDHMRIDHVPGLNEDGLTVTWSREKALRREDIEFMSWEHPMLQALMTHVMDGGVGTSTLGMIKNSSLAPQGTVLFELIYQLDVMAPAELQLGRYLPKKPIRLLYNHTGVELSEKISSAELSGLARRVPTAIQQPAIQQLKAVLVGMLDRADKALSAGLSKELVIASDTIQQDLGQELDRLRALRLINSGIREYELVALEQRYESSLQFASQANYQLRAVRVLIFN